MLGTFLILMHLLIAYVLVPHLQKQQDMTSQSIDAYLSQIVRRSQDIQQQSLALRQDSNLATEQRIADLKTKIRNYNVRLYEMSEGVISPKEMLNFIKVLLNEQQLRIKRLENDPPEMVTTPSVDSPNIYKHGVYIEASGTYLDHIRFLRKLEHMPWHIFWDKFNLDVEEDGSTTLGIEIYTLNFESDWIQL
jgi:MSHA biogenesis protein MshJ